MKQTSPLQVMADYSFDEKTIVIHPNDGYDLGLMVSEIVVRIFAGVTEDQFNDNSGKHIFGKIHLKNECRMGTVELSKRTVEKLGTPKKLRVGYDDSDGEQFGKILLAVE